MPTASFFIKRISFDKITSEGNIEVQLPGGGSDKNESPLHSLYREVLEETGWGIRVIKRRYIPTLYLHA